MTIAPLPPRTLNINALVRVELTDAGRRMWKAYYEPSGALEMVPDATPPAEFALWQLMAIFGPHLFNGMDETPFVGNRVTIL